MSTKPSTTNEMPEAENLAVPSPDYIKSIVNEAGLQLHRANGSGIFKPQGK